MHGVHGNIGREIPAAFAADELLVGIENIQHARAITGIQWSGSGIRPTHRLHRAVQQQSLDGSQVEGGIRVAAAVAA